MLIGSALLGAAVLAAALVVAVTDDGDERGTKITAGGGPSTTTSTSTTTTVVEEATTSTTTATVDATTTTTAPTGKPSRKQLAADPKGAWKLFLVEPAHCLELETGGVTTKELLCNQQPASAPVGALATVPAGGNRVAVAVVQPDVTGMTSMPHGSGGFFYDAQVAKDPTRADVSYLAGVVSPQSMSMLVRVDPHTVSRVEVPAENRTYRAGELKQITGHPYGRWPGYRPGGSTGLYWGGDQVLGFYDGEAGKPCVLYRRLGGDAERMLAEGCPVADAAEHLGVAALGSTGQPNLFVVLGFTDLTSARLRVDVPDGTSRTAGMTRVVDPGGSGWSALVDMTSHIELPPGTTRVTFVLLDDRGTERGRRTVQVPSASS